MIYKSRSKGLVDWNVVNSILDSSTRNNPANGITGVLIATETHFLQVLEGEFEALNATLERIARDTRHHTVQVISFTDIKERKFREWAMHGIGLFDLNNELVMRLCGRFGEDNGILRIPSTAGEVMELLNILVPEKQPEQAVE